MGYLKISTKQNEKNLKPLLDLNSQPTVQMLTNPTEPLGNAITNLLNIHYIADINPSSNG
jgi:hypothetical protein